LSGESAKLHSINALSELAERSLEVADLAAVERLLTRTLPGALGLAWATLLLWDRKLDSFHTASGSETQKGADRTGPAQTPPEARFLISEGALLETHGRDPGVLLPLMARSGLVGMLTLAEPPGEAPRPFVPEEVEQLSRIASRAALAVENHLYQQELIASERLAALGTMASMLAHDFRGPMTVIRGYAEQLLSRDVPSREVRDLAGVIVDTIDRLNRMTTETLDFARGGEHLALRTVRLRFWLESLCAELAEEHPGLTVDRTLEVDDITVSLDTDKLWRAVSNIAANAADAMGGAGCFRVRAVTHSSAGSTLALELSDQGPGVPAEIRERIFEPFVTSGKTRGTGLGLAVARRFVEQHGGRLELLPESPGAHFRITLPLAPRPIP
jgi:two-component system, NtrC family, sensor histidine kinase HydH